MSGGVDSSVAALLLKESGYNVVGVFMRCWSQGSSDTLGIGEPCGSEKEAEDARRVAEHMGIPFYVWGFEEAYKKRVVEYMIEGYRAGITPNPDVMCNREIKFGIFLEKALEVGADYVATGHYVSLRSLSRTDVAFAPAASARLPLGAATEHIKDIMCSGRARRASESFSKENFTQFGLYEAKDKNKDQSYFLWTLTQQQLAHCIFPIGDYVKPEVRAIARKAGLPTAEKKDSQGICFLGKVTLADFLKSYIPEKKGDVLSTEGKKIGEHSGAHFYTIGQRHGIGNMKHQRGVTMHEAAYVSGKDMATNTVVVAAGKDNEALYKKEVLLADLSFIDPKDIALNRGSEMEVLVRVRYRQPLFRAKLMLRDGTLEADLIFEKPQKFIAPGQSAVLYIGKEDTSTLLGANSLDNSGLQMLGGGIIV